MKQEGPNHDHMNEKNAKPRDLECLITLIRKILKLITPITGPHKIIPKNNSIFNLHETAESNNRTETEHSSLTKSIKSQYGRPVAHRIE